MEPKVYCLNRLGDISLSPRYRLVFLAVIGTETFPTNGRH